MANANSIKLSSPYSGGGARIGRQEAYVFNGQTVTDGQPGLDSHPQSSPFPGGRFGNTRGGLGLSLTFAERSQGHEGDDGANKL